MMPQSADDRQIDEPYVEALEKISTSIPLPLQPCANPDRSRQQDVMDNLRRIGRQLPDWKPAMRQYADAIYELAPEPPKEADGRPQAKRWCCKGIRRIAAKAERSKSAAENMLAKMEAAGFIVKIGPDDQQWPASAGRQGQMIALTWGIFFSAAEAIGIQWSLVGPAADDGKCPDRRDTSAAKCPDGRDTSETGGREDIYTPPPLKNAASPKQISLFDLDAAAADRHADGKIDHAKTHAGIAELKSLLANRRPPGLGPNPDRNGDEWNSVRATCERLGFPELEIVRLLEVDAKPSQFELYLGWIARLSIAGEIPFNVALIRSHAKRNGLIALTGGQTAAYLDAVKRIRNGEAASRQFVARILDGLNDAHIAEFRRKAPTKISADSGANYSPCGTGATGLCQVDFITGYRPPKDGRPQPPAAPWWPSFKRPAQ